MASLPDGYKRLLSPKRWGLIDWQEAVIVGLVYMNQRMVDVAGITDAKPGTIVVLIGRSREERLTVDDLVNLYGTI